MICDWVVVLYDCGVAVVGYLKKALDSSDRSESGGMELCTRTAPREKTLGQL